MSIKDQKYQIISKMSESIRFSIIFDLFLLKFDQFWIKFDQFLIFYKGSIKSGADLINFLITIILDYKNSDQKFD